MNPLTHRISGPRQRRIAAVLVGLLLTACGDPQLKWDEQVKDRKSVV